MIAGLVICICIIAILSFYIYKLNIKINNYKTKEYKIIEINTNNLKINDNINNDIKNNQLRLDELKNTINTLNNILLSLNKTEESLRQGAEKRAEDHYKRKRLELEASLQEHYTYLTASYETQLSSLVKLTQTETEKLNNLQAKQLAYIQAQQRQQEIDEKQDYFRLVVSDLDLNDIKLLRELLLRFFKKEVIDKLIWETYYKPAYDILMSHLFLNNSKICGIYKITNLENGLAYIGLSVDCKERFRLHIKTSLLYGNATNKLYQQMQLFGQSNFTFEILEVVDRIKLNERETYWIEFYKTKEYGMNGTKGGA